MKTEKDVKPVVLPIQVYLMLQDRPTLLAMYVNLQILECLGLLEGKIISVFSEMLGVSTPNFSKQCSELEKLKLIEKLGTGKKKRIRFTYPSHASDTECLISLLNVNNNDNHLDFRKLVDNLSEKLRSQSKNKYTKFVSLTNILSKYNQDILNDTNNRKRFLKEDYELVFIAYEKYTGAKRVGPERSSAWKTIRLMFLAGRKPEQIISFMEWLHDNAGKKEYSWLRVWDITYVQRKLPDYLAGRYKEEEEDDGFRQL